MPLGIVYLCFKIRAVNPQDKLPPEESPAITMSVGLTFMYLCMYFTIKRYALKQSYTG